MAKMKTFMTRRELLAAIGAASLVGCRGAERSQPGRPQDGASTVTLTVDGMV
jgi:hypothetical protein